MVAELRRILRIRPQVLLDVVVRDFLKRVILWSSRRIDERQRQHGRSRDDDFHRVSARRAAMKNRLRRDFVQSGLLCLEIGAALVEARDDDENDSGSKHQPGEKAKVLISAEFVPAA